MSKFPIFHINILDVIKFECTSKLSLVTLLVSDVEFGEPLFRAKLVGSEGNQRRVEYIYYNIFLRLCDFGMIMVWWFESGMIV